MWIRDYIFRFVITSSSICQTHFLIGIQISLKNQSLQNVITGLCNDMGTLQMTMIAERTLQLRHNGRDNVSNHQPHDCLLNRLFKAQIKETSKLRITALCEGDSPVTGEFPAQRASIAEKVSIWWRHHGVSVWTGGRFKEAYPWTLITKCH